MRSTRPLFFLAYVLLPGPVSVNQLEIRSYEPGGGEPAAYIPGPLKSPRLDLDVPAQSGSSARSVGVYRAWRRAWEGLFVFDCMCSRPTTAIRFKIVLHVRIVPSPLMI